MTCVMNFVFGKVENIVEKGENAGYQHFLLFQQCFQKASVLGSLKVGIVWERFKKKNPKNLEKSFFFSADGFHCRFTNINKIFTKTQNSGPLIDNKINVTQKGRFVM